MQIPSLAHWQRYPVTVGVAASAVVMTLWTNYAENVNHTALWDMTEQFWSGQLWRPLTSCLLHGDKLHLIFNIYFLWIFGAVLEEIFGSARMFLTLIFLAVGSSLAQYAFSGPGIGLSGVGYGLFGMILVLHRRDRRFLNAIDNFTVIIFIIWFFFCIAMTVAKIWNIGNVAHGSGALLGAMLGFAIAEKDKRWKRACESLLSLLIVAIFAAASVGREYINFSKRTEWQNEQAEKFKIQGYQAHVKHEYAAAADYYAKALAIDDSHAGWWYNYGLCCEQLGELEKAQTAFRHAIELRPDNLDYKKALEKPLPFK
jgi:membrane associated rhomboid family serine protease